MGGLDCTVCSKITPDFSQYKITFSTTLKQFLSKFSTNQSNMLEVELHHSFLRIAKSTNTNFDKIDRSCSKIDFFKTERIECNIIGNCDDRREDAEQLRANYFDSFKI